MTARRTTAPPRLRPAGGLACVFAAAGAFSSAACGTADVPVLSVAGEDGGGARPDGQPPPSPETLADFCAGSGPPVLVDDLADGGPVSTCPDQLAQRAFGHALCTCQGYVSDHALYTDAFDGTLGAYDPSTAVAVGDVGVNGNLHSTGTLRVGGSLWASSATDITTTAGVEVLGELHAEGEMQQVPSLVVDGDAWLAGGVETPGDVTIKGSFFVAPGAPVNVSGMNDFAAPTRTSFSVAPACDCQPSDLVDVAGVVATYRTQNDDLALPIDPKVLANVQADTNLALPCGRIYLANITADTQASIVLGVAGRVALVVDGDISASDFEIDVAAGGELDLFVAGSITVSGTFLVGNPANPSRARTYVGGSTVNLGSAATIAGNLYAPHATITLGSSAPTTLYGSLFASGLSATADLTIHYDDAIMTPAATGCPAP